MKAVNSIYPGDLAIGCMISEKSKGNLKKGGKIENYRVTLRARNKFICWLLLREQLDKCVHFVFTIPSTDFYGSFIGDVDAFDQSEEFFRQREGWYAGRFKYCLEVLRKGKHLGEYCWFKERTEAGVLHYHFIHDGFIDFKLVNDVWVKAAKFRHYHPNSVRTKKGHHKLGSVDVARYFGSYFKSDQKFYSKTYHIGRLPQWCIDGKIRMNNATMLSAIAGATRIQQKEYFQMFDTQKGTFDLLFRYYRENYSTIEEGNNDLFAEMLVEPTFE